LLFCFGLVYFVFHYLKFDFILFFIQFISFAFLFLHAECSVD